MHNPLKLKHFSVSNIIKSSILIALFLFTTSSNAVGPFDYYKRNAHVNDMLANVERNHLSPEVITLQAGITGSIWGDLDYTLRVFPNHPIALNSMARLFREKAKHAHKLSRERNFMLYSNMAIDRSSAEYYLDAAINYAPDDAISRLIYGVHLQKIKKYDEALEKYQEAEKLQPNHPEIQYNLGLVYFELKRYEKAKKYAQLAYDNGYPLDGLKNKLTRAGYWE